MKYIKYFESSHQELYQKINFDIFNTYLKNIIDFDTMLSKKIDSILDLDSNLFKQDGYISRKWTGNKNYFGNGKNFYCIAANYGESARNGIIIDIYQCEDEWFLVILDHMLHPSSFFKCDQWDGLIQFIKDHTQLNIN